ncbi:Concanavalin A-like lectin/glucanases superfamily protein [uncultured archaeon]|nr:Concanavalin A-like lectin/glucanases superfamily protein [uncultured archaeon]
MGNCWHAPGAFRKHAESRAESRVLHGRMILFFALPLAIFFPYFVHADATAGLAGWWALDDGSGTVALDSSGNHGNASLVKFPADNSGWTNGQIGQALNFRGVSGQRVVVAQSGALDFGTGGFTVSFWMKPEGTQNSMPISKGTHGYTAPGFRFFLGSTNNLNFCVEDQGLNRVEPRVTITSFLGSWNHYVGVWDAASKTATIYINGIHAASTTNASIGNITNAFDFTIGARSGGDYEFKGMIDDVRLYNRALSPQEVADVHRQGAPGGFTVENLGSPLQGNTQEHQVMYRTADGDRHLQLYYDTFGSSPMNIVDIDVDTGKAYSSVFENNLGRPGPQFHVYYPANNKIYIASSDPGSLSEFDPATGNTRYIRALRYKGAQWGEVGDDGWVYIGETTSAVAKGAGVERYNPMTEQWQDLGIIDPAFNGSIQYAYTLGADRRYVYIGLGQLPWYLAVYDTQAASNNVKLYWADQGDTAGVVLRGIDGNWYYKRVNPSLTPSTKFYKFEDGVPVETSAYPEFLPYYNHGNTVNDKTAFKAEFNTSINLDQAYPNSGNGNAAVIGWQTDSNPWQFTTIRGMFLIPAIIKRLYNIPGDSGNLLGWADEYGLVFTYNVNGRSISQLGYPQRSLYDATFDGTTVYLSGYTSATLRYDMAKPWTLSGSSSIISPSVNPYMLSLSGSDSGGNWNGNYHYYSDKGADGRIYLGAQHTRDSAGGGLGWYDPATGASSGLRQNFLNYGPQGILAVNNGAKIVYSSSQGPDPEGKLFVLDVASRTIERTITPIPGGGSLDKIIEAEPGMVIGITANKCYKVNALTGEIIWVKELNGTAFPGIPASDHSLAKGPDGYAWLFIDNALSRINPANGDIEKIMAAPVSSIMFHGNDLYFYGGTSLSRVVNISGALPPVVPADPSVPSEDSDGDGIPDSADRCPGTLPELASFVNVYGCPKPIAAKFDIKPDFHNIDLNTASDFDLGMSSYGKITYNKVVRLYRVAGGQIQRLDLDSDVNFSRARISINPSGQQDLNTNATVTLYGLQFKIPKILKDGQECEECSIISYSNGTIVFAVPNF